MATNVKVVTSGEVRSTTDFSVVLQNPEAEWKELLQTQIDVTSGGCVIAHFSAQALPEDGFIVFQVSIDNEAMAGHGQFSELPAPIPIPVVWDPLMWLPLNDQAREARMVAYNFVAAVAPGIRTVRVRFAGCCGATPPDAGSGLVHAAVLTLHY
jgi:hypothetical protein